MQETFKTLTYLVFIGTLLFSAGAVAQVPLPAQAQEGSILLVGATAHTGDGRVIENATVSIIDGKLGMVANTESIKIDARQYGEVIDVKGYHLYPGLILPCTTLGLEEISAVRATRDYSETGEMNPNIRSLIAYNTDSHIIPTVRYNGILLAQVTPKGGRVSGSSSVMKLDGWNWEDAAYKADDGIHIHWPSKTFGPRWWMGETKEQKNKNYEKEVNTLNELFLAGKSYALTPSVEEINLKLEALKTVYSGDKNLYLHASKRDEIIESIQWAKRMGIPKPVLVGAADAYLTIDFLKENKTPILLDMVHRLPKRTDEDIDLPYRLPAILHKAGLKVGLTYDNIVSCRNLPFFAGTAATYGLDKEEALSMVTANTADILGIGDKTGTLSVGKDANIIVSKGDLLDMRSNEIRYAFIEGRKLNLDGKQQRLFERYQKKYDK